jgi:serine/threonine protein kinase
MEPSSLIGRDLGGYRPTSLVGIGASAWVYRAESVFDRNIVRALKVITPALSRDNVFRRRFAEEARNLDRLRHPGIVQFYGAREIRADGVALLAMELELLDGTDLRQYASRRDPRGVSVVDAVRWVRAAAEAVGAAHALGIVHRDLKPENIQLLSNGSIRVLDFGIARAVDDAARQSSITMAGIVVGTPAYSAPEVLQGATPSTASDVYALGLVLYELLVGRHPFALPSGELRDGLQMASAHFSETPPPVTSLRGDVPTALAACVAGAIAREPTHRIPDAYALAGTLRAIQDGQSAQSAERPAIAPSPPAVQHAATAFEMPAIPSTPSIGQKIPVRVPLTQGGRPDLATSQRTSFAMPKATASQPQPPAPPVGLQTRSVMNSSAPSSFGMPPIAPSGRTAVPVMSALTNSSPWFVVFALAATIGVATIVVVFILLWLRLVE